jgi:hypothetical protein
MRHFGGIEPAAMTAFLGMLHNPAAYRARTTETIRLDGTAIRQHVRLELVTSEMQGLRAKQRHSAAANEPSGSESSNDEPMTIYIPIIRPLKGELVDELSIADSTGAGVSYLSYEETIQLCSAVLRLLVDHALGITKEPSRQGAVLTAQQVKQQAAEVALLRIIATRGQPDGGETQEIIDAAIAQIKGNPSTLGPESKGASHPVQDVDEELAWRRLRHFVQVLSVAYPVVASLSIPGGTTRVMIEYDRVLPVRARILRWRDRLRLTLGLRPLQATIPLDLAYQTDSYHLRVHGPSDQFVSYQRLECSRCLRAAVRDWRRSHAPRSGTPGPADSPSICPAHVTSPSVYRDYHFRIRGRMGQDYTHLYMRGCSGNAPTTLRFLVRFEETPPGTLMRALLSSGVVAVLVLAVGRIMSAPSVQIDSDIPALLLVLPSLAIAGSGFSQQDDSVLRSSLFARVSLILSACYSITAVVLFLLQRTSTLKLSPGGLDMYGVGSPVWTALAAGTVIHFLFVFRAFVVRSSHYRRLVRNSEGAAKLALGWHSGSHIRDGAIDD